MDAFDRFRPWLAHITGIPPERLTPHLRLRDFFDSRDSMDQIELIMRIEANLDLALSDADAEQLSRLLDDPTATLGQLAAILARGPGDESAG